MDLQENVEMVTQRITQKICTASFVVIYKYCIYIYIYQTDDWESGTTEDSSGEDPCSKGNNQAAEGCRYSRWGLVHTAGVLAETGKNDLL